MILREGRNLSLEDYFEEEGWSEFCDACYALLELVTTKGSYFLLIPDYGCFILLDSDMNRVFEVNDEIDEEDEDYENKQSLGYIESETADMFEITMIKRASEEQYKKWDDKWWV